MKYLAQVNLQGQGGCFRKNSDSLDDLRTWGKAVGSPGDSLIIVRNGDSLTNARHFTI